MRITLDRTRLREQLDEMSELATREPSVLEIQEPSVSLWGVSEQLDHVTKVLRTVMSQVLRGEETPKGKLNLLGRIILLSGFIPRGRGKSPESVRGEPASKDELLHAIQKCRKLLEDIEARAEKSKLPIFRHPFFGYLTRPQALRFLVVHNRHHFRIIRDILASAGKN